MKRILFSLLVLLAVGNLAAQEHLYISKQTGQFNVYQGQNGKTTDKYESGTVNIQVEGPLLWSVVPNELQIGPNQTKNWTGKVWGDVANAPAPGNSAEAKIIGNYNVTYSRPAGAGGGGNVVDTYTCDDGCPVHGSGHPGPHEIVNKIDHYDVPFRVYSIQVTITDQPVCQNGMVSLNCTTFPAAGNVTWTTPWGQYQGTNVVAPVPPGFPGGNITATYTVEGVSYSDTKFMAPNTGTLNGFTTTQMCIGDATTAPNVTLVTFAGPGQGGGCPANNLIYAPLNIGPPLLTPTATIPLSVTSGNVTLNSSIIAVNKNKTVNQAFQIDFGAAGQLMTNITNAFSSALSGVGSPCNPTGSWIPAGQISRQSFSECCINNIKNQVKYEGQVNWAPGIGCRFPFYGIPYIASIDFIVNAGANVSLAVNGTSQCVGNPQICATATATASLGVGVGGTVLSGFIQADLTVVVDGISCEVQYCFNPPPAGGTIKATLGKVKVVGTLSGGWGLASYSVDYPILDGYTTPAFSF